MPTEGTYTGEVSGCLAEVEPELSNVTEKGDIMGWSYGTTTNYFFDLKKKKKQQKKETKKQR